MPAGAANDIDAAVDATLTASRALLGVVARSVGSALELVTPPQFRVLVVLSTEGPLRTSTLAARMGAVPSTFTRSLDRMEASGWIVRRENPESRREVLVDLTDTGHRLVEDVTDRRRADEQIAHLAHYDALTDLPNRALFREQIERELEKLRSGDEFALLYIDIDEFKGINDSLGHHIGDVLLKSVAKRIRDCLDQRDLIARLGGDEFAVIQTGFEDDADVVAFVGRIQEVIRQPHDCLGHHL